MARIFVTGSSDGLGLLTAKSLIDKGHKVVLHARNTLRKNQLIENAPGAEAILIGDLSDIDKTKALAQEVNNMGAFDAVIHNAGVYHAPAEQIVTVNVLAPYILTCLIQRPKRLIYLCSDMHLQGSPKLDYLKSGMERISYSDIKLQVLMLCKAVARKWSAVYANAVDPGWVPTKMGGKNAPGNLQKGYETQVWLATSDDEQAKVSGHQFFHQRETLSNPIADDGLLQEEFLALCKEITGITFPPQLMTT